MYNDFYTEPIILSEHDSIDFVNELRMPDTEYIERRDNVFSLADSEMTITDCENGFIVDIPDLDISALKKGKRSPIIGDVSIDYEGIIVALANVARASEMLRKSSYIFGTTVGDSNAWNTNGISTECEISVVSNVTREELVEGSATDLRYAA